MWDSRVDAAPAVTRSASIKASTDTRRLTLIVSSASIAVALTPLTGRSSVSTAMASEPRSLAAAHGLLHLVCRRIAAALRRRGVADGDLYFWNLHGELDVDHSAACLEGIKRVGFGDDVHARIARTRRRNRARSPARPTGPRARPTSDRPVHRLGRLPRPAGTAARPGSGRPHRGSTPATSARSRTSTCRASSRFGSRTVGPTPRARTEAGWKGLAGKSILRGRSRYLPDKISLSALEAHGDRNLDSGVVASVDSSTRRAPAQRG